MKPCDGSCDKILDYIKDRLDIVEKKIDNLNNFKFQVLGIVGALLFIYEIFLKK